LLWLDFEAVQDDARALKANKDALELELRGAAGHLEPLQEAVRAAASLRGQHAKRTEDARAALEPLAKRHQSWLDKAAKEHEAADGFREDMGNLGARAEELAKKVAKLEKELAKDAATLAAHDGAAAKAACQVLENSEEKTPPSPLALRCGAGVRARSHSSCALDSSFGR
jgi:chromosome segregation ATPase